MDNTTAFGLLLQAALLTGAQPPQVLPAAAVAHAEPERRVGAVALSEVLAAQEGAFVERAGPLDKFAFAAAFDHEGAPWIKARQGAWRGAYPAEALVAGVEAELPSGRHRLWLERGIVKIKPAARDVAPAAVAVEELYHALYERAAKLNIPAVEYALLHEAGESLEAAVCLLRRDDQGRYWVGFNRLARLARVRWFAAVNGQMYGMRVEGPLLVFVTAPVPPVASGDALREIAAPLF